MLSTNFLRRRVQGGGRPAWPMAEHGGAARSGYAVRDLA